MALTALLSLMLTAAPVPAEPQNGSPITVELRIGTVSVELQGRLISCSPKKRCAQLPTGRRVQGRIESDRFIVEDTP